jgi:predicted polyphosphate/ATP-dependent NAD kinase
MAARVPLLGVLVNPIAGVGGPLAFKGSDDRAAVDAALAAGAELLAPGRMRRALAALARTTPSLLALAAPDPMGDGLSRAAGLPTERLTLSLADPTGPEDTAAAARELAGRGVDLLLFAGGDGTARDIAAAVGETLPLLGVPCGVKMRSGVFAPTPEAAGEAAGRYLDAPERYGTLAAEVLDATDPQAAPLASELFALARVPAVQGAVQRAKGAAPRADAAALDALCAATAAAFEPGRLYLIGPGTTTARIMASLSLPASRLGVDAVRDGRLLGADLDEAALLALLEPAPPVTLILGVIGKQGFLLGRGNQQLSPAVLRRVGAANLLVLAGAEKVLGLEPPLLRVDLDEEDEPPLLSGYLRVHMAPGHSTMLRVAR